MSLILCVVPKSPSTTCVITARSTKVTNTAPNLQVLTTIEMGKTVAIDMLQCHAICVVKWGYYGGRVERDMWSSINVVEINVHTQFNSRFG